MKNKFIEQEKLYAISINIMARIEDILQCLGVELRDGRKMLVGPCPIHGGDKYNAFNLYTEEDSIGAWKCRTHNCHRYFAGNIIGFIRGVLSRQKCGWSKNGDEIYSFANTLKFISECLNEDFSSIKVNSDKMEQRRFINYSRYFQKFQPIKNGTTREDIRKILTIPCPYFIKRNFLPETLDYFDIGTCNTPSNTLFNSSVVPIYDLEKKFVIGTSARSIWEKCTKCGTWHNPKRGCPNYFEIDKYSKWRHSNFKRNTSVYNYWNAARDIYRTKVCILTESPGNVWALQQAGLPIGLATYGTALDDNQIRLLNMTGALSIILIGDNDKAGHEFNVINTQKLRSMFDIHTIIPCKNDIGDMTIEEIKQQIKPVCIQCKEKWAIL
jgi:hypothetical protein